MLITLDTIILYQSKKIFKKRQSYKPIQRQKKNGVIANDLFCDSCIHDIYQ
jgi:hypothetical protein